jgi:VIT1/CCC1 family predicted Fe2+/Mn2+ transporter
MDLARPILKEALPASVVAVLEPQEIDALAARIAKLPPSASHATLERRDYLAAIAVLAAVVLATVPVVLPLALIHDRFLALRVSNGTAIAMLYVFGRSLGKSTGNDPLQRTAGRGTGAALVAITDCAGAERHVWPARHSAWRFTASTGG